uniref:NADH-ubiquinone oxidoreductase chain 2 n=1 Tax=Calophya schini TaxID=121824 RepID=A0A343LDQ9_9HEMI|nr:NADH dehydrogenase subunit 2 [Calophya schini]
MKNYNLIIYPIYSFSIILGVTSQSWTLIWVSLEINLLSFIFLLLIKHTPTSAEAGMKYFMIQSLGSLILLTAMTMNMFFNNEFSPMAVTPLAALMVKSGVAPLHTWTPNIISNFPWVNFMLFLTAQKIVPVIIMFSSWFNILWIIIMINIMIGSIGGILQSSFKKMMLFSSINNVGWMMLSMSSIVMFTLFLSVYFIMNLVMIKFISKNSMTWIVQIKSFNLYSKLVFFSLMCSMSGIPPFLGFMPKWMIIKKIHSTLPLLTMISLISSVVTLFFYFKVTLTSILGSSSASKSTLTMSFYGMKFFMMMNLMSPGLFMILT